MEEIHELYTCTQSCTSHASTSDAVMGIRFANKIALHYVIVVAKEALSNP
jgi:hypothetical protein